MKKTTRTIRNRIFRGIRYVPLILWVGFFGTACLWIVFASFSTTKEIFSDSLLTSGLHFENYIKLWKTNNVSRYFINSIFITGGSCLFAALVAIPASFVLAKKQFHGKKLMFSTFVIGMSVPQVMMIIPIYSVFARNGWVGSIWSLILIYGAFNVPYTIYFLTAFFQTIPGALEEAALIDGCSQTKAMWKIMVPLASPGIITVTIFNVMGIWNEYFIALIFANGNDKIRTLSMGLQNMISSMTNTGNWAGLFASVMIVFMPTFVVYLFLSEKIIAGITGGGVKG